MATDKPTPISLTPEDADALRGLLPKIRQAEVDLDRLERAGLDVAEMRAAFENAKALREGLLRELAPPRVRRVGQ